MKGYLVSCSIPKSKQKRQILCLACVAKLMGQLKVGADSRSLTLCDRGHNQQDALLFERRASGSWKQTLELTNELLEAVVISNESTVSRKKPKKAAAESALNRGMQAGSRAREMLPEAHLGIAAQATLFLTGILDGTCRIVVPAGVDACGPPMRLYMTYWDHNRGRPKALGKPSKEKALLEECCKLVGRDFQALGELGMLSAPCPLEPPPCGGEWVELWQDAVVHASTWSQAVRTRIYSCKCPRKHTVHFDGEHLGLYVWSRQTIVVQESLQLLLKQMQRGQSGFGALLEGQQEAFRRAPECAVLSEETWRKASLDFFRLVGRQILECCSICGPHPEVLLCDGIVGITNSDGGKRPGGLGSTSHDFRRPFTHPSRSADGTALEKQSVAGRDYCAAGLEGGGMKRRLVLQPELRELIARVSRHRPESEKLGQRLSEAEFLGLKEALGREDVLLVTRFVPGDGEGPVPADTRRRLLVEQRQMVRGKNRAMHCGCWRGSSSSKRLERRGLPRYTSFEHEDGRSRTSEEFKCATGQTVGEWDAANVPGLVKGGSKSTKKGKRPHRSRGAFLFCCPHRVISGFHFFLRGESPRDAFAVLYTRKDREDLPKFVVYDNACQLRNYCMRREPAFFSDVTFVVDRFHYAKAGAEVHKCGPSNATEYYDALRWVNTSAVESVNSFLKKFRVLGWYSGLQSLMVFLPILLSGFNLDLSRVDDAKLSIAVPARLWSEAFRAVLLGR
ncbi:hypothetical protein KFL_003750030 [Klebsormidium nitens]|uniref:Uncharacterized protein n=1 Tax=Klebsormidium nitens TaxID=105231 RepID=A0A1Y1IB18_KLENI|nr:hypothetical protein KFL_003750030 [Klebsormidium nitens]|eukprot:GAQ87753.1 hypothetical protein KFL_003750030 [Klebsormidium nitens]